MSLPSFPTVDPPIEREGAVNQILSSIAMEELGLSHILNAEGEKMQYILGTLPGLSGPAATITDVLAANDSVRGVLEAAMQNQLFLKAKMESALNASPAQGTTGATGPTGPTGPTGSAVTADSAYAANTSGATVGVILGGTTIPLPNSQVLPANVTANAANTIFTVAAPGLYRISYSVNTPLALAAGSRLLINGSPNVASTLAPSVATSRFANEILVNLPANSTISLELYGLVAGAVLLSNAAGATLQIVRLS